MTTILRSIIDGTFRTYSDQMLMDVHKNCHIEFPKGKLCCVVQAIIDKVQLQLQVDNGNLVCGNWDCVTSEGKEYAIYIENNNVYIDNIEQTFLWELRKYLNEPFPETKCKDIKEVIERTLPN